jgi:hypothetical protein
MFLTSSSVVAPIVSVPSENVEVSLFVLSPDIEDRDEVKVATGRSTKRPSTLNGTRIYYFIFQVLRYSYWIERSF